jgi:conjugative transfer pilus assembly protein TraH
MKGSAMNILRRSIAASAVSIVSALSALACLAPSGARAGILSDMSQLIMSNSTAPSTISTQDRVGVFGGSYEMRAPVTAINLVAFDPPRIDAGCGGIDLFMGSFSFINAQQLVQVFRAVAQNSLGLAFKAAIMYISPGLDKLMTEFQTVLQDMNKLAKNSCQLAHLIVNPAEQALGMQVNADGSIAGSSTGLFSDQFGALTGYLQSADSYLKNAAATNPNVGNTTVKTIMNSGVAAMLGLPGLANADGSSDNPSDPNTLNNRLLVSFMGYEITGQPCSHSNQAGTPDTSASGVNPTLNTVTCEGAPTLTLKSVIDGGGPGSWNTNTPLQLYQCLNPNGTNTGVPGAVDPQICTSMQTTNYNYIGIRAYVNNQLFGNPDPAMGITSTSILGQMNAGTSVNLTPDQAKFLNTIRISLIGLIAKSSNPSMRQEIAERLANHVTTCIAAGVGDAVWQAANTSQTGGQNNLPKDIRQNYAKLYQEASTYRATCAADHATIDMAAQVDAATRLLANNAR